MNPQPPDTSKQREACLLDTTHQREPPPPDPPEPNTVPSPPPEPDPDPSPDHNYDSEPTPEPALPRKSFSNKKPVEIFKSDKAHGYFTVRKFFKSMITICSVFPMQSSVFNANFAYAMAVDPYSGIVTDMSLLKIDFLIRHPNLFKAGKKDADSPGIMEALSGPYRE